MTRRETEDATEDAVAGMVDALIFVVIRHDLTCECPRCDRLLNALHGAIQAAQAEDGDDDD